MPRLGFGPGKSLGTGPADCPCCYNTSLSILFFTVTRPDPNQRGSRGMTRWTVSANYATQVQRLGDKTQTTSLQSHKPTRRTSTAYWWLPNELPTEGAYTKQAGQGHARKWDAPGSSDVKKPTTMARNSRKKLAPGAAAGGTCLGSALGPGGAAAGGACCCGAGGSCRSAGGTGTAAAGAARCACSGKARPIARWRN